MRVSSRHQHVVEGSHDRAQSINSTSPSAYLHHRMFTALALHLISVHSHSKDASFSFHQQSHRFLCNTSQTGENQTLETSLKD